MKYSLPKFKYLPRQTTLGILAVLAFFMANMAEVHSHFCLDGQEPALTVHFENLVGHPEHGEKESEHNDLESEVSLQTIKVKSSDLTKAWLAVLDTGVLLTNSLIQKVTFQLDEILFPQKPDRILPPLRAPPILIS